jgi:hypothetical protein
MALGYGLAMASLQLGVQSIIIKPKRAIGPFVAHVTLRERHVDELEIVDHPVEQGALISDHAFKRPPEVTIECAWSDSPRASGIGGGLISAVTGTTAGVQSIITGNSPDQVRDVYLKLLALQNSATLIDVHTGKRSYKDMLIRSIMVDTDKDSEHVLNVTATLRQVLIATVRVVSIAAPKNQQADPQATVPSVDKGIKQLLPSPRTFNPTDAIMSLTPQSDLNLLTP